MAADPVHLKVTQGEDTGQTFSIPLQGVRIGRSSDNDIPLRDPLLSRHHCRVEFREDAGMWLTDLGSANRTRVNNKEVTAIQLHTGDTIQVGDSVLNVLSDTRPPTRRESSTRSHSDTHRSSLALAPDARHPEIPGYQVKGKIGSGGMAVVWKARQESLDRVVAIKVLKRELTRNPKEVKDFIQEARAAAKLRHPNIVRVHDAAELGETCYIVMEYVEGSTIGESLDRDGPMKPKEALHIISRVAHALSSAWKEANIIHRDIKPDNIILDKNGTVKLTDLGLARIVDPTKQEGQGQQGAIEGTPNYMSPEQARGESMLDSRTDMYSLGATLYHMVTGKMPFRGVDPMQVLGRQITDQIPNPRNIDPDIPIGVAQFISKLMMKDPEHRFPEWPALLKTLRKVQAGGMILGEADKGAVSTIAAQTAISAKPGAKQKQGRVKIPAIIRVPAWILLLLWLVLLAYNQLADRVNSGLYSGGRGNRGPSLEEQAETLEPPPLPSKPVSLDRIRLPAPRAVPASLRDQLEADRTAILSLPSTEPVTKEEMSPEEAELFEIIRSSAALRLLKRQFLEAYVIAAKSPTDGRGKAFVDGLEQLRLFILQTARLEILLEDNIADAVGQKVTMHMNNRDMELTLRAMLDDRLNATLEEQANEGTTTNSLYFSLDDLDPIERSRWLGPANTRPKCAMKYLLYMERGDRATAAHFAANCGILSEPFAVAAGGPRPDHHE